MRKVGESQWAQIMWNPASAQCATAYLESKDGRIVFGDEETVTGLHLAKGFARVELAVASLCEGLGDVLHCEEIDG